MTAFTNKHVIIAMIVAPILAITAYFGVDAVVSEKPHAAKAGARYELLEMPNCRYKSGICGLKNGDFELKLSVDWLGESASRLHLRSIFPLDGVRLALINPDAPETAPVAMQQQDDKRLHWTVDLQDLDGDASRLRLAVSSSATLYFGEVAARFSEYETSFGEDFRESRE